MVLDKNQSLPESEIEERRRWPCLVERWLGKVARGKACPVIPSGRGQCHIGNRLFVACFSRVDSVIDGMVLRAGFDDGKAFSISDLVIYRAHESLRVWFWDLSKWGCRWFLCHYVDLCAHYSKTSPDYKYLWLHSVHFVTSPVYLCWVKHNVLSSIFFVSESASLTNDVLAFRAHEVDLQHL